MRLFFYAKTGHRVGLDRLRRSVALLREFEDYDPLLMVQDFRAASYAKSELNVKRTLGVDDIKNISNVCQRGDILIFDSDEFETNEYDRSIHEQMIDFFGKFIRISDKKDDKPLKGEVLISPYLEGENIINSILVDKIYFGDFKKEIEISYFFGDDDYEKNLLKVAHIFKEKDIDLIEGFYFFVNYQEQLRDYFKNIYEIEDYEEVIKKSKIFITSSSQSALEALATDAKVIYIQREDKNSNLNELLEKLGVKILEKFDENLLINAVESEFNLNKSLLNEKNVTISAKNIKNKLNL